MQKMRKRYWIGFSCSFLLLTACNDMAEVTDDSPEPSTLTLEEVFNKTLERQQGLNSVSADINMEQNMTMTIGAEDINMNTTTNMNADILNDPVQFYAEGTMSIHDAVTRQQMDMPMQMYRTEKDGFYMYQEEIGWYTLPEEQSKSIIKQAGIQNDPNSQLTALADFLEDFTFEQTADEYILTLEAEGEKFLSFIMEQTSTALEQANPEAEAVLENTTIENADYILTIDKENFNLKSVDMDLIVSMNMSGMALHIDQISDITYSNYNEVENIVIPPEVIREAQSL